MLLSVIFFLIVSFLSNCSAFSFNFFSSYENEVNNETDNAWNGTIWAVLVAGSNGWYNYRHQADICHAYQVLHEHGIPDKNIIVMMYDDIAHNEENPTPGVIINKPNGKDVYKGVPKDYIGKDVTPEMLLKVLQGDQSLHSKGRKVVKSGPNDHIFLYFSDHGAPGLIAFPDEELYATDLNKVLKTMAKQKKFNKMAIYIEACESGSMFSGLLPSNINIFATTAANSTESSYACYYDEQRETYLGDVYSVNWIEDSDSRVSLKAETLQQQFSLVLEETNTSHVKEFGDKSIGRIHLNQFQGSKKYNNTYDGKIPIRDAVQSGDVPLAIAQKKLLKYENEEQRYVNQVKYEEMLRSRNFLISAIKRLLQEIQLKFISFDSIWSDKRPLTNHECYINLLQNFDNHCFDLSTHPYALRFLYVFVNMCESLENQNDGNVPIIEDWISTIVRHCSRHISGHPFKQIL